jgi:hypothetical protein
VIIILEENANVFFISGLEQKKVETSVSRLEMKRDWAQRPFFFCVLKIAPKASLMFFTCPKKFKNISHFMPSMDEIIFSAISL